MENCKPPPLDFKKVLLLLLLLEGLDQEEGEEEDVAVVVVNWWSVEELDMGPKLLFGVIIEEYAMEADGLVVKSDDCCGWGWGISYKLWINGDDELEELLTQGYSYDPSDEKLLPPHKSWFFFVDISLFWSWLGDEELVPLKINEKI